MSLQDDECMISLRDDGRMLDVTTIDLLHRILRKRTTHLLQLDCDSACLRNVKREARCAHCAQQSAAHSPGTWYRDRFGHLPNDPGGMNQHRMTPQCPAYTHGLSGLEPERGDTDGPGRREPELYSQWHSRGPEPVCPQTLPDVLGYLNHRRTGAHKRKSASSLKDRPKRKEGSKNDRMAA